MNQPQTSLNDSSRGFFWPSLILGLGFVLITAFILLSLKGRKRPHPLVIKPSSVKDFKAIASSLHRALYPLANEGYGAKVLDPPSADLEQAFESLFLKKSKGRLQFQFVSLNLNQAVDTSLTDCKTTALFNMNRRIKKWTSPIYFSVCKEKAFNYKIYFTQK